MTLDEFTQEYELNGETISSLVASEVDCPLPSFIKRYPRLSHLWQPINMPVGLSSCWWAHLSHKPEDIIYCPTECLTGSHWVNLMILHKHLRGRCDWSKLRRADWERLVIVSPSFRKELKIHAPNLLAII